MKNGKQLKYSNLFKNFIISSVIYFVISIASDKFLPKYSFQSQLLNQYSFNFMANFDGYHYITNYYSHLPNFAFLPGYTLFVRLIMQVCDKLPFHAHFLMIYIANKVLFWLSIKSLVKICKCLNMNEIQQQKCALLYIYNPVFVFFNSIYSQCLYSAVTFKCVQIALQYQTRKDKDKEQKYWCWRQELLATLLLMLAVFIRSTGLFLLPVLGISIVLELIDSLKMKQIKQSFYITIRGAAILLSTLSVFVSYLVWSYFRVCKDADYCKEYSQNSKFINIYSFVQDRYWNVGFLTYFTYSNIVFILIGLPSIIFTIIFLKKPKSVPQFGLQLSLLILLIVTITMTNLQSSTRFLCSHPAFYLNCVSYLQQKQQKQKAKPKTKTKTKIKWIIGQLFDIWRLGYFYVGIVMFSLAFPWT